MKKEVVVKMDKNVKIDVYGEIVELDELLELAEKKKSARNKKEYKAVPAVIRKYEHAVKSRNALQDMLMDVRKMYAQHNPTGSSLTVANSEMNGILTTYLQKFMKQSEQVLSDAIELSNLTVERSKQAYEKSMYFVSVA